MKEQAKADEPPEDKHSYSPLGILAWIFAALVVYVLSIGPAMWLDEKGYLNKNNALLGKFYSPLEYGYKETILHKPLGIYLHFWVPQRFDKNGD